MARRRLPGWLAATGWGALAVAAAGLPTALVVAALDSVRRSGSVLAQRVVLAALVVLAVMVVVALERGLTWAARNQGLGATLGYLAGAVTLVALGVVVQVVGLVLVAVLVVLALPLALAGIGTLVWWRWRNGPRASGRAVADPEGVRASAEARRVVVRDRHARTRLAVERGYVGPGFTRGRGAAR